jgi:proteic killer suppression protein
VIGSFKCSDTERLASGFRVRRFVNFERVAQQRKLEMIHNAANLEDLRIPPGNRLEKLAGDRDGQYSIRINDQWRICFEWREGRAYGVEIVDYH